MATRKTPPAESEDAASSEEGNVVGRRRARVGKGGAVPVAGYQRPSQPAVDTEPGPMPRYARYLAERAPLIDVIEERARQTGLRHEQLPEALGIPHLYFKALVRGTRRAADLPRDRFEAIAKWLGRSTVEVMVLAGFLRVEDIRPFGNVEENVLRNAYQAMRRDPYLLGLVPDAAEWERCPLSVKVLVIVLYQRLVGAQLMELVTLPGVESASG